eukprot:1161793-Pelagomonas_calceolata.AAC.5
MQQDKRGPCCNKYATRQERATWPASIPLSFCSMLSMESHSFGASTQGCMKDVLCSTTAQLKQVLDNPRCYFMSQVLGQWHIAQQFQQPPKRHHMLSEETLQAWYPDIAQGVACLKPAAEPCSLRHHSIFQSAVAEHPTGKRRVQYLKIKLNKVERVNMD